MKTNKRTGALLALTMVRVVRLRAGFAVIAIAAGTTHAVPLDKAKLAGHGAVDYNQRAQLVNTVSKTKLTHNTVTRNQLFGTGEGSGGAMN